MGRTVEALFRDFVHALRSLRRAPGFALVTVATLALALAIGANTAIFSVAKTVLLDPALGMYGMMQATARGRSTRPHGGRRRGARRAR